MLASSEFDPIKITGGTKSVDETLDKQVKQQLKQT